MAIETVRARQFGGRGTGRPDDVDRLRARGQRRRLSRLMVLGLVVAAWCWGRFLTGSGMLPTLPSVDPFLLTVVIFFVLMLAATAGSLLIAGRSPHVLYRPEQIDVRIEDVKGLAPVTEDVHRSLELFRSAMTFRSKMGGSARRGLLFEGSPGTGKTHMAKAMAAEAGVPFLFVSATSFQSMYYGATGRKIRSFFKELRRAARREGGAIAFIEEIDAIGMARQGVSTAMTPVVDAPMNCGGLTGLAMTPQASAAPVQHRMVSGDPGATVNELLVQMQSFDELTPGQRALSWLTDRVNLMMPATRQIPRPRPEPVNVLVIAATNRADSLDPALLRPGRFDRKMTFGLPDKAGRRELIDHFLTRKAHENELADDEHRDALAGVTQGYSPVMIEHLLDEALVNAVRRDAEGMSWSDIEQARLVTEVGLGQPVGYTDHEIRLIATHEAGHAVSAWLLAPQRRLEILTIVKRAGSLGLLAHGDRDDVYTRSKSELGALISIAFGGQVAEELFFGDISTGPGGDLAYATTVAAQMIGAAGMSDTLISFAAAPGSAFGGGDLVSRVMGDGEGRAMMEKLLTERKRVTRELLEHNRHLVEALRDALLERHELIGGEIDRVLRAAQERVVVDLRENSDAPRS
ncbi:AAA family ATPase [Kineosporia succinea]|uniref:ATP-dependent Zn protease n=1 Tax=Kineosporia succinea TaxID=84632 RepID=A0ABT9NYI3_9ACTN|nr:AAA family ATPase [Kineosporia succinea]MDP9825503.1 ATP-dependent Zn protease [Kineosporia succinea]